jgi:uncharacterized membrane protein
MDEFKFKKYIYIAASLFILTIIIYAAFFIHKFGLSIEANSNNWGQFGSYLGGVLSPVFAFMSFIALLFTINIQRIDIKDRRNEAKEQKVISEKQKTLLDIQRFETTFFNMLNQTTNIINNYTFNQQEGASFFRNALVNLWNYFHENTTDSKAIDIYFDNSQIHIEFKNFVLHIANVIKLIQNSNIENKDIYYEILLGFLSNRQKYFIEICCNSSQYFTDVREYLNVIHRSEKRW